jgi:hypothetical protein
VQVIWEIIDTINGDCRGFFGFFRKSSNVKLKKRFRSSSADTPGSKEVRKNPEESLRIKRQVIFVHTTLVQRQIKFVISGLAQY